MGQPLHLVIFLLFFSSSPHKLSQVGWGLSVDSHFQVCPEMFDWVQVSVICYVFFVESQSQESLQQGFVCVCVFWGVFLYVSSMRAD